MEEAIEERKRTPLSDDAHSDLFSNLIRASEEGEGGSKLSEEELMGMSLHT